MQQLIDHYTPKCHATVVLPACMDYLLQVAYPCAPTEATFCITHGLGSGSKSIVYRPSGFKVCIVRSAVKVSRVQGSGREAMSALDYLLGQRSGSRYQVESTLYSKSSRFAAGISAPIGTEVTGAV